MYRYLLIVPGIKYCSWNCFTLIFPAETTESRCSYSSCKPIDPGRPCTDINKKQGIKALPEAESAALIVVYWRTDYLLNESGIYYACADSTLMCYPLLRQYPLSFSKMEGYLSEPPSLFIGLRGFAPNYQYSPLTALQTFKINNTPFLDVRFFGDTLTFLPRYA